MNRVPCNADGHFQKQVSSVNQEGLLNRRFDGLGQFSDVGFGFHARKQQRKFIGAKAASKS